ncbi:hypothetical protein H1D32_02525 [Anaerobacillus sp. CMMVII]|uniref:hypothetical protein n=1 Tax=Anaerobacillus sp. CMMVII TaxID=2755588 RepID=UPI0021B7DC9E|nr:hypothetical protein [Anaerobacillus sp. CMMVII]MCT8136723.1 hypothetical protein [Anaerobacillus sp. CMMVII]
MKKLSFLLLLALVFLTACGNNSWVLEDHRLGELSEIESYVNELQTERVMYKGYKVFTISEGKKAVVISLGKPGTRLDLVEVQSSSKDTVITIKKTDDRTDYKNSYIVVGLDEIKGAFYVLDENQEEFFGTGYYMGR